MKNICIIANFEKTYFFSKVFEKFNSKNVFWIVVNKVQNSFLKTKFNNKNILYLPKINRQFIYKNNLNEKIKLNEIIFSDRILNNNSMESEKYLLYSKGKIERFLKRNNINYVLGELSWAIEVLTFRICQNIKFKKIQYLNPASIRIPQNRFLYFTDIHQSKYLQRNIKQKIKRYKISKYEDEYSRYISTLNYQKNTAYYYKKIKKLLFNDYFDKYDPTGISKFSRIKKNILKKINKIYFNLLPKKKINFFIKKKYVIFFLQKKPEASIDVKGMYYEDNFKNIQNIWKILPPGFSLVVKEHPSNVGNSKSSFYKKILSKNNVYLVENKVNFSEFVLKSFATFSVNSTASLNASNLCIPSFTFSDCYFNELKFSMRIMLEDLLNYNLLDLVLIMKNKNKTKKKFINSNFVINSYKGELFGNNIYNKENLNLIRNSVREICK